MWSFSTYMLKPKRNDTKSAKIRMFGSGRNVDSGHTYKFIPIS